MSHEFIDDLVWRGLVHQCTDLERLRARIEQGPVTVYCGFDPTAASLHVGSLIPLLALARFQQAGHRVLALVGGATGLIGDPSGKSAERVLQTEQDVATRAQGLAGQISRFVDLSDARRGALVNNLQWTSGQGVLEFLRDVGKHFSVNAMVARDSVRSRLEREGEGISFTEFSYMLLQAQDFLRLHERQGCQLQIGGSDQWGNMCSGVDLIRRVRAQDAFAMTFPLLTTRDGQKFGKTVKGAVWLDEQLTCAWDFFQFWLNAEDADVVRFLKLFTFVPRAEIEQLEAVTREAPHERRAQRRLAVELTTWVHGPQAAADMEAVAAALFGKSCVSQLSATAMDSLSRSLPCADSTQVTADTRVAAALVALGIEPSMSRANEALRAGAVQLNGTRLAGPAALLKDVPALHGRFWLLRKGKKTFGMVRH